MIRLLSAYFAVTSIGLVLLARMILKIGTLLSDCPQTGRAAPSAAMTIATGYSAIGLGGVLLIGAAIPILADESGAMLLGALGFAGICLGLGFTQAVTSLRGFVADAANRIAAPPAND